MTGEDWAESFVATTEKAIMLTKAKHGSRSLAE